MIGDLLDFGIFWYHPNGIANMLSLGKVQDTYQVTYDSAGGNHFLVHGPNRPNSLCPPKTCSITTWRQAPATSWLSMEKKKKRMMRMITLMNKIQDLLHRRYTLAAGTDIQPAYLSIVSKKKSL